MWNNARGTNVIDGGAHFYNVYVCADGKYIAIGSIEPQFYSLLREKLGLEDPEFDAQMDAERWPELKERLERIFRQRTREQWCSLMEGSDACFAPVLNWDEAPQHPHNRIRGTFIEVEGVMQPAPAPRFSRTPTSVPRRTAPNKANELIREWGLGDAAADELVRLGGGNSARKSRAVWDGENMRFRRFSGSDGVTLAADVGGDPNRPHVLLMHGGGQTRFSWGGRRAN